MSPLSKERKNISSAESISLKHSLRAIHTGILIGSQTLRIDSPRLDIRVPMKETQIAQFPPRPIVLASNLRELPLKDILLKNPIIFTTVSEDDGAFRETQAQLPSDGIISHCSKDAHGNCCLKDCLSQLYSKYRITSLLVEGGAQIIQSFLETNYVDQAIIFIKPSFLGGYRSLTAELSPSRDLVDTMIAEIGGDVVIHGKVR